jgi:hypothetical protein
MKGLNQHGKLQHERADVTFASSSCLLHVNQYAVYLQLFHLPLLLVVDATAVARLAAAAAVRLLLHLAQQQLHLPALAELALLQIVQKHPLRAGLAHPQEISP